MRNLFPRAADIASGRPDSLFEELKPSNVPEVPANRIAYVDGYGNLKTTIRSGAESPPSGSVARVRIGDAEVEARVSDDSFEVEEGVLAFAPGSSGWTVEGIETA